jgi:hypothetical protein
MFKIMFFLWRRQGMSAAEFRNYYEDKHAHNNQKVRPASADYRRNYPAAEDPWTDAPGLAKLGGFDVMTENFYPDRAAFQKVLDIMIRSPAAKLIEEDEARFEIRDRKKVFVVHEVPTLDFASSDYEAAARHNEIARFKFVRYVRRAENLTPGEFRDSYEKTRAPAMTAIFANSIDYRRNYLQFEDALTFNGPQETPTLIERTTFPCDMIEEIWFESREAAEADHARFVSQLRSAPGANLEAPGSPIAVVREHRMPRPRQMPAAAVE